MISAFIREFVLPLLLFLFVRSLLSNFFSGRRRSRPRDAGPTAPPPAVRPGGKLFKDPICGTYVSSDTAVTLTMNGETSYFCSAACCEKFTARRA